MLYLACPSRCLWSWAVWAVFMRIGSFGAKKWRKRIRFLNSIENEKGVYIKLGDWFDGFVLISSTSWQQQQKLGEAFYKVFILHNGRQACRLSLSLSLSLSLRLSHSLHFLCVADSLSVSQTFFGTAKAKLRSPPLTIPSYHRFSHSKPGVGLHTALQASPTAFFDLCLTGSLNFIFSPQS